ncbi:hypothetical protein KEM56_003856 [Ascosphaera pollenicola]|nr:hypothetical protein KEM56_003856 [Ascosphaera pollenicola]
MPMPEFITNRVLNPQEANPPPGFYPPPRSMRNPVPTPVGGYPVNNSRTAYGFVMVPGGQASSWDQRFPRPPQYPQPPYQGQDPRMMPPHPMAQQQSFTPSSYPPYAPGMMGPQQMLQQQQQQQQQQHHSPGLHFMQHQQSKHATVGPQSSHVTPPSQTRTPEGFEQVSQNHLRYNPHHGETPPMLSTGHTRAGTSEDDLAEQLGAVRLNDKHGGRTSRGKYVSRLDPAKAQDDLRAQEDEREKNRLRKLQSAKSRRWDARKDENGKVDFRKDKNDPERLALQRGPDRQKEDRERREMLLNDHLESDDDGVVYPEPGRLEPIDFGDKFEKKDDSSNTTPSGKHKDKQPHPPGYKLELRPLPDIIEPGKSWADMMDEDEEEWW